jgi:hypothetical protein
MKKSLFEDELMNGMQRELQSHAKKQGMNNLAKAVDYLQAAMEIFEESGMTKRADQVVKILGKIAHEGHSHIDKLIEEEPLIPQGGAEPLDLKEFEPNKFDQMIQESLEPLEPSGEGPLDIESFRPISLQERMKLKDTGMADDNAAKGKPRKPKNPTKVSDKHTKGLTPERMLENLKHHCTEFNMADDGSADDNDNKPQAHPGKKFDKFYEQYVKHIDEGTPWGELFPKENPEEEAPPTVRPSGRPPVDPDLDGLIMFDGDEADDMLDADLDEKPLEVHEDSLGKTFEDSD